MMAAARGCALAPAASSGVGHGALQTLVAEQEATVGTLIDKQMERQGMESTQAQQAQLAYVHASEMLALLACPTAEFDLLYHVHHHRLAHI